MRTARFIQNLINPSTESRVDLAVVGSPSLEGFVQSLKNELPSVNITLVSPTQPSLESQQLDEEAERNRLEELQENLQKSMAGEHKTGPMQIYLLDGQGLAAGDPSSQATLRALAAASLADPSNTVAALLPQEDGTLPSQIPSQLPEAIQNVMVEFLGDQKVTTLESRRELIDFLARL